MLNEIYPLVPLLRLNSHEKSDVTADPPCWRPLTLARAFTRLTGRVTLTELGTRNTAARATPTAYEPYTVVTDQAISPTRDASAMPWAHVCDNPFELRRSLT